MEDQPPSVPPGYRHIALDEVDSTNAFALSLAGAGEPGNLWVTAARQTAGRGRRGRRWVSEAGNLHASLLLVEPAGAADIGTLPLVAALGVYRALKPLFARHPQALAIKWPNDILVDGQKVGGILLESMALPKGGLAVVIGCGVNCAMHPATTLYPTTDLAECGIAMAPAGLFAAVAIAMAGALSEWAGGAGFAAVRQAWLQAAGGVGGPVTVRSQDGETGGVFEDIDEEGYLVLNDRGQRRRIMAGDLFFAASAGGQGA